MELSKNKSAGIARTPWLVKLFETYFAPGQFVFDRSNLVDIKWRADGNYCVMLFETKDGFYLADVAGYADVFEVCNDGEDMDLETWKTVKVDPWCDSFTVKEDRE